MSVAPKKNVAKGRDYSFIFTKARFGGNGSVYNGNTNNNKKGNGNRKNQWGGNGSGGPLDGQDPDDDDEGEDYKDEDVLNVDLFPLTVNNASKSTHIEYTTNKPGAKLPSLHPKEFYWNGERPKLRPYIQRWYDHLNEFENYAALMFLQRCVPPNYKNIVLSHQTLVSCLQYLATYCANKEMYCKRAV